MKCSKIVMLQALESLHSVSKRLNEKTGTPNDVIIFTLLRQRVNTGYHKNLKCL